MGNEGTSGFSGAPQPKKVCPMKKILIAAVALSVLVSAGAATAAPGPQGRYEQNNDRNDGADRSDRADRNDRADRADRNDRNQNRYERRADRRYAAARYQPPRGYAVRNWRRGERLPASYRAAAYRVDYRVYRLAAPPRGYHYVRVGNDVVLVADNNGIIASVILQLFR